MLFADGLNLMRPKTSFDEELTLSKRQILDFSKLKELADDIFKVDENGIKFYKQVENIVVKGKIVHYEQFLLFP